MKILKKLKRKRDMKLKELAKVKGTSIQDMWVLDLDTLENSDEFRRMI